MFEFCQMLPALVQNWRRHNPTIRKNRSSVKHESDDSCSSDGDSGVCEKRRRHSSSSSGDRSFLSDAGHGWAGGSDAGHTSPMSVYGIYDYGLLYDGDMRARPLEIFPMYFAEIDQEFQSIYNIYV